jgi:hypothetical protein
MAINEKEFKRLRRKAEAARVARDKAAGQLEAAMDRLQDEFGCNTVEAAEKKVAQHDREAKKAEASFEKAVAAFEEEWDDQLGEI